MDWVFGIFQDYYANGEGHVNLDKHQDCIGFNWNNDERIIEFSRRFDTCDDEDYIIEVVLKLGSTLKTQNCFVVLNR